MIKIKEPITWFFVYDVWVPNDKFSVGVFDEYANSIIKRKSIKIVRINFPEAIRKL